MALLSLSRLSISRVHRVVLCCVDHVGRPCDDIIFLQYFSKVGRPVKILNGAKHTREILWEKRTSNTSNMAGLESIPGLRDNKPATNHSSHDTTFSLDSGRSPCRVGQNPNSESHADVYPFPKRDSKPQSQCLNSERQYTPTTTLPLWFTQGRNNLFSFSYSKIQSLKTNSIRHQKNLKF